MSDESPAIGEATPASAEAELRANAATTPTEPVWLIERIDSNPPVWWRQELLGSAYTSDANQARKFPTREAADLYIRSWGDDRPPWIGRPTEHVFLNAIRLASPVEREATPAGEMSSERVADIVNAAKMAVEGTWRGRVNTKVIASRLDDLDALFASHERSSAEARSLREALAAAQKDNEALESENARLVTELAKDAADRVAFRRIEVVDGKIEFELVHAQDAMRYFACAALSLLETSQAENYVEMTMGVAELPGEIVTLRLQRNRGKTPHQLRLEAEAKLAASESSARSLREEREALTAEVDKWRAIGGPQRAETVRLALLKDAAASMTPTETT